MGDADIDVGQMQAGNYNVVSGVRDQHHSITIHIICVVKRSQFHDFILLFLDRTNGGQDSIFIFS